MLLGLLSLCGSACGSGGEPQAQPSGQDVAAQASPQSATAADGAEAPTKVPAPIEAPAAVSLAGPDGPLGEEGFRALMEPFDMAKVQEHLQGAWVFSGGVNPIASAWHIDGDAFAVIDARGDVRAGELRLLAPCRIAQVVRGRLSEMANFHTVVATAEGVHRAGASMGVLRGDRFVVCTASGIVLGDASGCGLWRDVGGLEPSWERSPATCERIRGGADTLRLRAEATGTIMLTRYGERLLRWPPEEALATEVEGLDAALAAVRAAADRRGE